MARIFISHSSRDNFEALAFRDWLISEGWGADDVFLDLHGIGAGARWKDALAKANERCEAVLFLVSPHALASNECYVEIRMAEDMGKAILPTILPPRATEEALSVEDPRLAIYRDRQIVDASIEPREASFQVEHDGQRHTVTFHAPTLARIKARLDQLGISPDSFAWTPGDLDTATPYPGLVGFTERDAALFFGRAGDIARGMASVRKLRRAALDSGRGGLLVIQAASGAGKSSFLKAGLWPRLIRDPDFTPVAILRPATGILTGENGVSRQLAAFFARHNAQHPATEINRLLRAELAEAAAGLAQLVAEATEIGRRTQRLTNPDAPPPTPVIAVDQAEELFAKDDAEESRRFLALISALIGSDEHAPAIPAGLTPPLLLWTIRADSMDTLLHATTAHSLGAPELFPLPPIPQTQFAEIINGPLAVANLAGMRLSMDPLLTQTLIEASKGADALPLLAYTLRQLVEDNRTGSRAHISLDAFESGGGIGGVLRKRLQAAQRTADASEAQLKALFVPNLATWDAEASPPAAKRLVADEAQLLSGDSERLRPLADALVAERLLTRGGEVAGATTLEVAHEALLRQPPIVGWLEQAREFLIWRDAIGRARRSYEANERSYLMGRELEIARGWREGDMGDTLSPEDRGFIEASVAEEDRARTEEAERERQRQQTELEAAKAREEAAQERAASSRRVARRTMVGMVVAFLFAVGAGVAGLYAWQQQQIAHKSAVAEKRSASAAKSERSKAEDERAKAVAALADAEKARQAAEKASQETLLNQSKYLTEQAAQQLKDGDIGTGLLLALEALPDATSNDKAVRERPHWPLAEEVLNDALFKGRELAILKGHTGSVYSVAALADGRLVTGSYDNTARVWTEKDGAWSTVATLKGHTDRVYSVAALADGRLVTGSYDNTARVWAERDGAWTSVATLKGHTDTVSSVAALADGRLVTGAGSPFSSDDNTARVWAERDGAWTSVATLKGHTDRVSSVAALADGRLVTGSADKTVRVWAERDGAWTSVATLKGHTSWVTSVAVLADGRLVTGSADETVRVWAERDGAWTSVATLKGHTDTVSSVAALAAGRLVTGSYDNTARVWTEKDGAWSTVATLKGHTDRVYSVAALADGRLVTGSYDNTARVWAERDGAWTSVATLKGHTKAVTSVAALADGRLVTGSYDNTARVWAERDGAWTSVATLKGHDRVVTSVAALADGRLITGSADNTARVWAERDGAWSTVATLKGHTGDVTSVAALADGRLVTGSADDTARVWAERDGAWTSVATLKGHTNGVTSVAALADGRLVTGSDDNTARVLAERDGAWATVATLKGHNRTVGSVAALADGRLVTGSADNTARVWAERDGAWTSVATLKGHISWVTSVAALADGRLVTGSWDDTARVWAERDGAWTSVATLKGHTSDVTSVAALADGRLVTGSDDTARVWGAHLQASQATVNLAKAAIDRCLTPFQRQRYYLSPTPQSWCDSMTKWPYDTASRFIIPGRELLAEGKDAEAEAVFAGAIARDATKKAAVDAAWVEAYLKRGKTLVDDGRDAEAQAEFDRAVARDATQKTAVDAAWAKTYLERGKTLLGEGRDAEAEAEFAKARERGAKPASIVAAVLSIADGLLREDPDNPKQARQKSETARRLFDRAMLWGRRDNLDEKELASAVFGRGRALVALGQYAEAIADFREAKRLGFEAAGIWLWWATDGHAGQLRSAGKPVDALIAAALNYLDLAPELRGSIKADELKVAIWRVTYPISDLHAAWTGRTTLQTPETQCDRLAAHPNDPFRPSPGVPHDKINVPDAIKACTEAIAAHPADARFFLYRARAYNKAADDAAKVNDDALAKKHHAATFADLEAAMAEGYPMAFNNKGYALLIGDGIEKDEAKGAQLYLETFNRVLDCCWVPVARHLLAEEAKHDTAQVRRVVHELTRWAVALKTSGAAELLEELYASGKANRPAADAPPIPDADFKTSPPWLTGGK